MNWKCLISELIASGMTQVQIAQKAGCTQASISDLATGRTENPAYSIGSALIALHKKATRKRKQPA